MKYLIQISTDYWKLIHNNWDDLIPSEKEEIIQNSMKRVSDFLQLPDNEFEKSALAFFEVDGKSYVKIIPIPSNIDILFQPQHNDTFVQLKALGE